MRFFTLASALLASSSAVLAAPASEQQNQCCCCDILAQQIVCISQTKPDQCMCAQVMCPDNSPTMYASGAPVATTVVPASLTSAYFATATANKFKRQIDIDTEVHPQCCCCDPTVGSIICNNVADANNCSCSGATCPDGAPTIHAAGATSTPTPPPKAHPLVGPIVIRDVEDDSDFDGSDGSDGSGVSARDYDNDNDADSSQVQEQDQAGDWCCHCDYVNKVNYCYRSAQCPFPKIDLCEFETVRA